MRRVEPWKCVAFEAPTAGGRRVRVTADADSFLTFDACDVDTGELLGRVEVRDANPVRDERRWLRIDDEWSLDTRVAADVWALDEEGRIYRAVAPRIGTLCEVFDCLLSVTIVKD